MYRVWQLGEQEKGKIVRSFWNGDSYSYDVYDSQEEADEYKAKYDKLEAERKKMWEDYMKSLA